MKTSYRGIWYSPKFPDIKISGILTIDQDDIELKVYAPTDFRGKPFDDKDEIHTYRILLGECHGHKITLLEANVSGRNFISESLQLLSIRPQVVMEGRHFDSPDDVKFKAIGCSYSFLSAWMEDLRHGSPLDNLKTPLVDFDTRMRKVITIDIGQGFAIRIEQFLREHDFTDRNKTSYQIHHAIDIVADKTTLFDEFKIKVHHFRKLLELGMDTSVNVWFHSAHTDDEEENYIHIYHPQSKKLKPKNSDSFLSPGKMLFSYYKLEENEFTRVIKKWFETLSTHEIIYDFYLDTNKWFKGTGASLTSVMFNNRVLNVIQGLESFHSLNHQQEDESQETFDAKLAQVISNLSEPDLEWIKARSSPLRKSLRKRLTELLDRFGFVLDKVVVTSKEKKGFVSELLEIRNSLSHARHAEPYLGIKNEELYFQAKILLLTCILHKLGLEDKVIKELIVHSYDHGRELRYCEHQRGLRIKT